MKSTQIILTILSLVLNFNISRSQPGTYDSTFYQNGYNLTSLHHILQGWTLDVFPDNSIVTGGSYRKVNPNPYYYYNFLKRFNSDGTVDTSFGISGLLDSLFQNTNSVVSKVKAMPNGKILAALSSHKLIYLNSDGSFDSAFGSNGVAYSYATSTGFDIQSNGKIVAAGVKSVGPNHFIQLSRYLSNGALDSTFGINGMTDADITSENNEDSYAIKIQTDDKVLIAGCAYFDLSGELTLLARYSSDGTLDSSFGNNGTVITPVGTYSLGGRFIDMDIQQDGKIVVAGRALYPVGGGLYNMESILVRFNTNGSIDSMFGVNGSVIFNNATNGNNFFNSIDILPDGKIVAGGYAGLAFPIMKSYQTCVKFDANGSVDSSFANNGIFMADLLNGDANLTLDLACRPDGKLILTGQTSDSNSTGAFMMSLICLKNTLTTDINSLDQHLNYTLYPNPSNGNFTIKSFVNDSKVLINDLLGRPVHFNLTRNFDNLNFSITGASGIYIIRIVDSAGIVKTARMIKY